MKYYYLDEYDESSGQAIIYTEKVDGLNANHKVLIEKPKYIYEVYGRYKGDIWSENFILDRFLDKTDAEDILKKLKDDETDGIIEYYINRVFIK